MVIDIEIDEPYAGNDGTPIHYEKDYYGSTISIDRERNEYFTSRGFEVIRFAEEQIFSHTEECAVIIRNFLNTILAGDIFDYFNPDFEIRKWTSDQSSRLAYRRFRRTYVPSQYHKFIDKEEYRSYHQIIEEIQSFSHKKKQSKFDDDLPF